MLILMGIIQLGFLFGAQIGLTNAVREAARFGSLAPTMTSAQATSNGAAVSTYLSGTAMPQNVPGFNAANLTAPAATYCYYQNPGTSPASYSVRLTVTATYGHQLFIPLVGIILDPFDGVTDSRLAVTSRESFRVENAPLNLSDVNTLAVCP
jgi:hypothetical protein